MKQTNNSFASFQQNCKERIQHLLDECLAFDEGATRLNEAMRYSVLNGGKRLRPLLVYATGLSLGVNLESLDSAAVAVELMHCYSLIHDDLPAMDNDDLRRGKATCHIAFDEATAILAGDALQMLAITQLCKTNAALTPATQLLMINSLAKACGPQGMIAGQMLDLAAENQEINLAELNNIHHLKTGALISCCIELAALAANCSATQLHNLQQFARHLGLAFQIQDDILDVEGNTVNLGKRPGADQHLQKSTYPKLLGMAEAKLALAEEYAKAAGFLEQLPRDCNYLADITEALLGRQS